MQQQIPKPSFKVCTGKQNAQVRRFIDRRNENWKEFCAVERRTKN